MSEAEEITILALPRSAAMAVAVALVVAGCGGSPTSPTSTSDPSTAGAGNRQFSGMVELPASTLMDVSLRIQNRTVDASPLRLTFVALLIAQENGTVRGSYTLHTVPPREGQIDGTFGGASFLTAGIFDGTFTETTPSGCLAQRNYSGAVTAAGINLLGGRMLQQCPETPFDGLAAVAISVADGTGAPDPDPDPDPDPAPDPDPDPDPGQRFTLTVTRDGSGLGTVTSQPGGINCGNDCSEPYDQGTVVTLIPTPDQGATFIRWGGDADCEDGRVTMNGQRRCTATFNVVPENTLAVTLSGAGTGTVTSNPPGISCGFDCSEPYSPGTVVRLTATADSGSTFVGWSGDPDCSDAQVTMDGVVACTATFDQIFRTLTVTVNGTGSGTVTASPPGISCPGSGCTKDYAQGTAVALIATPAGGSTFAGWSGAADCADGNVTMNGARACTATFDLIPPNTLAVTVTGTGSGTVTSNPAGIDNCPGTDCSEAYSPGTMVTLSATPGANSIFGGWTGDADCSDGMVTLSAAIGCTATFDAVRTLTTVISGGTGTVTSNPGAISCPGVCTDGTYLNGTDVTLTALATGNSTFAGWSGTGCGASVSMTADRTCTANFIPPRTLDITIAGGGTGTVTSSPGTISCPGTCTDAFTNGTVVALTPTPTGGSTFAGWSGTGCSNSVTMSIDRACTATFDPPAPVNHTLTVIVAGTGTGDVSSDQGGIACSEAGGDCTEAYLEGTAVVLTATPSGLSTFAGWTGNCDAGGNVVPNMDAPKTCTATFNPPAPVNHTLTVIVAGTGTGDVSSDQGGIACSEAGGDCTEAYLEGTAVVLTATPSGLSTFAGWTGNCDAGGNVVPNMDAPKTCTATFDP